MATRQHAEAALAGCNKRLIGDRRIRVGGGQKNSTLLVGHLDGTVGTEQLVAIFSSMGPICESRSESFVEPGGSYGIIKVQY